jgi:hypothetical protein
MKIRPVGVELFHSDRRTDGKTYDEAYSRFSQIRERSLKPGLLCMCMLEGMCVYMTSFEPMNQG